MPKTHNIADFTRLFRQKIQKPSNGLTAFRLMLDRVHARTLRVLTHVTVENRTSGYTKCRLGIVNSGTLNYLDELVTIAADELAVSRSDILLGEGDVFFAELTGTTLNDFIVMSCVGWELDLK